MRNRWICAVMIAVSACCAQGVYAESDNQSCVGVSYWTMADGGDFYHIDENGYSWLLTYQYGKIPMLKMVLDFDVFPEGFQGIKSNVYVPEFYLVFGSALYGAVGAGILMS